MRIIFVRHGEPDYEKDVLTETGWEQARAAAGILLNENIEEIWSSPLGRAHNTAEATSELLGKPVKVLDFMRELRWGSRGGELYADGHPWDTADRIAADGSDLGSAEWRAESYFCNNCVTDSVNEVESGIDSWLEGLGYKREGLYYRHTKEEAQHRTIALFCHGGSSSAAIGHILNLPFPYVCALLHLNFTGMAVLRFDRKEGSLALPCLETVRS